MNSLSIIFHGCNISVNDSGGIILFEYFVAEQVLSYLYA
jgi:hypothetical protein